MILQEIIKEGEHIHCLVVGRERVLPLHYSIEDNCYLDEATLLDETQTQKLTQSAVSISQAYGYDINMIEYLLLFESEVVRFAFDPVDFHHEMMT